MTRRAPWRLTIGWASISLEMADARRIIEEALALDPEDRARVAEALIESLDEDGDPEAGRAWAAEIERRVERVLAGESEGAPWEQVRERLRARRQPMGPQS